MNWKNSIPTQNHTEAKQKQNFKNPATKYCAAKDASVFHDTAKVATNVSLEICTRSLSPPSSSSPKVD